MYYSSRFTSQIYYAKFCIKQLINFGPDMTHENSLGESGSIDMQTHPLCFTTISKRHRGSSSFMTDQNLAFHISKTMRRSLRCDRR